VDGEFLFVNALVEGLFVEDDLVAVDEMFLQLMGEDTFDGGHSVGRAYLVDHSSHFVVEVSGFYQTQSGLSGLVGSKDDVSLGASDQGVLVGLDNDGVGNEGSEAVDVDS
jgi:hypothetical protein